MNRSTRRSSDDCCQGAAITNTGAIRVAAHFPLTSHMSKLMHAFRLTVNGHFGEPGTAGGTRVMIYQQNREAGSDDLVHTWWWLGATGDWSLFENSANGWSLPPNSNATSHLILVQEFRICATRARANNLNIKCISAAAAFLPTPFCVSRPKVSHLSTNLGAAAAPASLGSA